MARRALSQHKVLKVAMRSTFLALIVGAAALLTSICPSSALSDESGEQRDVLRAASSSFPDYLDPQLSYTYEGWTAMYATYVPLLTYRHAGGRAGSDFIPGLAKSLPKISDGGRTYTLFLRPGLRYSNGTRVRASDFEYAIKRMFKLRSGGQIFYTGIAGAKRFQRKRRGGIGGIVANDKTGKIVIHLVKPRATFEYELAMPFASPVPQSTPMRDRTFRPPPSTGPYALTVSGLAFGWTLKRNPAWTTNGELMPQLPDGHVDEIDVEVIRSGDAQVKGVKQGKLDAMLGSPPANQYAQLARRYRGTQFLTGPLLSTYYFWMNTTRPPFDDLRVRRAVNYAIDRRALRRIHGDRLIPSQQIIPEGMPGHAGSVLYPHDMRKARELIRRANPADREITVWTDNESPAFESGVYYRNVLRRLGFHAHLKVTSGFNYFSVIGNTSTPNLDTGWGNWFADYPHPNDFFQPLLAGSSILPRNSSNFAQIDVPALNRRIARLNEHHLGSALEQRYAVLDRSFMKLAPIAPYGSLTTAIFVSKAVDLDKVVWSLLMGADLTSFRFR
jgi:peptide/nickel transport system substrate-binding protein